MADILTNLRELGVAFFLISKNTPAQITPQDFIKLINNEVSGCQLDTQHVAKNTYFDQYELQTLHNSYNLSMRLKQIFNFGNPNIVWCGNDIHSGYPYDLIVDDIKLSLKEDSFILENMGLYKILNILTDTDAYQRGLHVFEEFSRSELLLWFEISRDCIVNYLSNNNFEYKSNFAYLENNDIVYQLNGTSDKILNFKEMTYFDYKSTTRAPVREKIISKIISLISNNMDYIKAKQLCCQVAGENILKLVEKSFVSTSERLLRLFRVTDENYYYCKSNSGKVQIFEVPELAHSKELLKVTDFTYSVPNSQLNLLTEIANLRTGNRIQLRNEIRYSHGQLNGTPEAKLYYSYGGDLSILYNELS